MKKLTLFVLLAMLCSSFTFAQDESMQKWMAYMTPGNEHKELAKQNGDWVYSMKSWMDPASEPTVSEGTATCEMMLDGRYQLMKVYGNVMGMPFNGISTTAFDNGKKIWISTWIDNLGTGLMYAEGKYDESTKCIVFKGKMYDPMSGKDIDFKENMLFIDENTMGMDMFSVIDGKDVKNMEIRYTRKK
ncbi:MAG: DUF1579 domain-containing protein [Ignavibacteria bacterium]|nr:DUF1579 domain-containing protein [Ignavibacteria bacterium]